MCVEDNVRTKDSRPGATVFNDKAAGNEADHGQPSCYPGDQYSVSLLVKCARRTAAIRCIQDPAFTDYFPEH